MSLARNAGFQNAQYIASIVPGPTRFPNVYARPWMRTQSPWYWDMLGGNTAQLPYVGSGSTGMGYGGWAGLSYLPAPGAMWGLSQAHLDVRRDKTGPFWVGSQPVRDMNGGSMLRRGPAFPRTVLGARSATTYGAWGKYDLEALELESTRDYYADAANRPKSVGEIAADAKAEAQRAQAYANAMADEVVRFGKDPAVAAQAQAEADAAAAAADEAASAETMNTLLMVGAAAVAVGGLYLLFGRK